MAPFQCFECGFETLSFEQTCPVCGNHMEDTATSGMRMADLEDELDFSDDRFYDEIY